MKNDPDFAKEFFLPLGDVCNKGPRSVYLLY
jgi:hypothetical protein